MKSPTQLICIRGALGSTSLGRTSRQSHRGITSTTSRNRELNRDPSTEPPGTAPLAFSGIYGSLYLSAPHCRPSGSATASWMPRRGFPPATSGTRESSSRRTSRRQGRQAPRACRSGSTRAFPKGRPGTRRGPERQASGQLRWRYQSSRQSARLVGEDEQRARGGGQEFSVGGAEAAFGEDHARAGFYD